MKIAIIVDNYPAEDNLYANGFIHQRVKEYLKHFECVVFNSNANKDYLFETVLVKACSSISVLEKALDDGSFDRILIHFIKKDLIDYLITKNKVPVLIWVHGYECLSWIRYYFSYSFLQLFKISFYSEIVRNVEQRLSLRKLIKYANSNRDISFIFVSNWMKERCESDTWIKVTKYKIIPNPINTELFKHREKGPELATNILLIRSFNSRKYANDIAIKAILILSQKDIFTNLKITIYGKGKYFESLISQISKFPNVQVHNSFLSPEEIKVEHDKNGIFLCPTRMDAQGVSMCEAMASNLVIISSLNTAIPEFVDDNINGILTSSPQEIAEKIAYLNSNPNFFNSISRAASIKIMGNSDVFTVINQEISLIRSGTI